MRFQIFTSKLLFWSNIIGHWLFIEKSCTSTSHCNYFTYIRNLNISLNITDDRSNNFLHASVTDLSFAFCLEIGRCPTACSIRFWIRHYNYNGYLLNASDLLSRDRFYNHWYESSCNLPDPRYSFPDELTKALRSNCPCSACIFQVVVSLLIYSFHIFSCTYCISVKGCGCEILWRWSGLVSGVRWRIQYAM